MKLIKIVFLFLLMVTFSFSCKNKETQEEEAITQDFYGEQIEPANVREIFYNLYLPEEMSRIFESAGSNFDPDLPNSPDNFSQYTDPREIAMALGIYGVDLNYARLFDQNALTANYFTVIQILSEKLGIPESYYEDLFNILEDQISNRDTIVSIATRIYEKTDQFLKERGDNANAALIIFGGWVEALYIACNILEENPYNMEVLDRISEQKYSLNSLIFLLSNYHDDILITEYILMLKKLRKAFDRFEIYFRKEKFTLDTANRMITASDYVSEFDENIAKEISTITEEIRTQIIN
jgi:hypothetical protein